MITVLVIATMRRGGTEAGVLASSFFLRFLFWIFFGANVLFIVRAATMVAVRPISGARALDQGYADVIAGFAGAIGGRIRGGTRTDSRGLRAARGICAVYPFWAR